MWQVKTIAYFRGLQETQARFLQLPMEGYSGHMSRRPSLTIVDAGALGAAAAQGQKLSASMIREMSKRAAEGLRDGHGMRLATREETAGYLEKAEAAAAAAASSSSSDDASGAARAAKRDHPSHDDAEAEAEAEAKRGKHA